MPAPESLAPVGREAGRPGRRGGPPDLGDAAGFTLIELLVVLVIIAALVVSMPTVMAGIPGFRLRAAASDLAEALRRARDDAIRGDRVTELTVLASTVDPTASSAPTDRRLKPDIAVETSTAGLTRPDEARTRFRFFPDGSASGGVVRLRQGDRTVAVSVDWLTGRVRIGD